MRDLTFYEFAGVFLPGAVVLIGLPLILFPPGALKQIPDLSLGGFGVGLIASYVAGHLLQAVGNLFEQMWWHAFDGMPTESARTKLEKLVGTKVATKIDEKIQTHLDHTGFDRLACDAQTWRGIVRECHTLVDTAGRAARTEIFNGNYGLFRGLSTAFLFLSLVSVLTAPEYVVRHTVLTSCFLLAVSRMHRFAMYYARELFVEFSAISKDKQEPA